MSSRLSTQEQTKQIDAILANINTRFAVKRKDRTEEDSAPNRKRVRREQSEESATSSSSSSRVEESSRVGQDNRARRGSSTTLPRKPSTTVAPIVLKTNHSGRTEAKKKEGKEKPNVNRVGAAAENTGRSCSTCGKRGEICGGPVGGGRCRPCSKRHSACTFSKSRPKQAKPKSSGKEKKKGKKGSAMATRAQPAPGRKINIRAPPHRRKMQPQVMDDAIDNVTDTEDDTEEEVVDWKVELARLKKEIVHDLTATINNVLKEVQAVLEQSRKATTAAARHNERLDVWERRVTGLDQKLARIGSEIGRTLEIASGTLVMLDHRLPAPQ
ncbi:hypothetical protein FRC19_003738 [Serendipita sp. 401]|nr:hypothetical protein FRC19_003738 [Serendipita sp. 401]KAG9052185.1 hypothetical protein FS842_010352 [Serendipita sp. 407]